jgi:hypothetical protein
LKGVIVVSVYVVLDIYKGIFNDVNVFKSEDSANRLEQEWLKEHKLKNEKDRECLSQSGTELRIFVCELQN